ncbi:MAG: glycosyl hydrolase [Planctomycetota bacterium]|nr:MAG: glycosyl hydrolase [Planctomycetota bacterium]
MTARVALLSCDDSPVLSKRARRGVGLVLALLLACAALACSSPPTCPPNKLTEAEAELGWQLLFDGETLAGWELFGKPGQHTGWQVVDGTLARTGSGGDLITDRAFADFELQLEWRISEGGNSGIFYRVATDTDAVWRTGPEMQVLDNTQHPDGRSPYTSAGANYALYAPLRDATRPVGEWNRVHIVVKGNHVEHWLNGERQCEYEIGSEEWEQRVASSKFASMPRYGREPKGHIALQDHGDLVWYRGIKVRALN